RDVIAMRLNRGKYFSLERPTGTVALDPHIRLLGNLAQHDLRRTRRATTKQRIAGECSADECSPLHTTAPFFRIPNSHDMLRALPVAFKMQRCGVAHPTFYGHPVAYAPKPICRFPRRGASSIGYGWGGGRHQSPAPT